MKLEEYHVTRGEQTFADYTIFDHQLNHYEVGDVLT
jgi:hypothetical protein